MSPVEALPRAERRRRPRRVGPTALAVLLSAALVATACSDDSSDSSSSASSTPPSSGGSSSGALVPFDTAAMDKLVDDMATEYREIGMMVLIRTPQGEYVKSFGTVSSDSKDAPNLDTKVRIGSNTKTWTGTAIMQLVEEGKISVDDPVSKYRPDVPNGENITVGQLLNMRSGLYNYTETVTLNEALDNDPQKVWTPEQLLGLAFANPPYFPPGGGYHYSNTNTVLLGLIAEQLDGKPIAQIFQDRFFSKLNMSGSSFPANTDTSIPAPYASGYSYSGNIETLNEPALSPERIAAIEAGTVKPRVTTNDNPSWTWSAGQGIATANDLATWVKAMGDGELLNEATQKLRIDSVQPTDPDKPGGAGYGYGIAQMGPMYGHIGEMPGYNSFMGYDPANDVTMVVWANLAPTIDGNAAAAKVANALVPFVYNVPAPDTASDVDEVAEDTSGG
ncbi:serine hydrolase domain-containing protein [Williamsia sp. 1135]|uniref:serine hydrolase domain-containing protein n=1 Tax=Williamsia sp. 1135 TaxID=1889262 RepID=UPI000A1111E3|nr:serine hydrolase domain-containing protein [Williamsia sp. 1135]ORM30102.1 D-alanyl-D-alanine carboxypeptidase [Williamsia sp. 1135]